MADYKLTLGNDSLTGTDGDDRFSGVPGGVDTLDGGAGNDLFDVYAPNGQIDGGAGSDTVKASILNTTVFTHVEILDTSNVSGSVAQLNSFQTLTDSTLANSQIAVQVTTGGGTIDFSTLAAAGHTIAFRATETAQAFNVTGTIGNDQLFGSAGNDTLLGGEGHDWITAYDRSDTVTAGSDSLSGGNGNDTIDALHSSQFAIDGGSGDDSITSASTALASTIDGGTGDDTITIGNGPALTVNGGAGDDLISPIYGSALSGTINGGDGLDTIAGDVIVFKPGTVISNVEILQGVNITASLAQIDSFARLETTSSSYRTYFITLFGEGGAFNLAQKVTTPDITSVDASTLTSGIAVIGTVGSDSLVGTAYTDTLQGGAGSDGLSNGIGDTAVSGNDILDGGAGNDTLYIKGATLPAGVAGTVSAFGGADNDTFVIDTISDSPWTIIADGGDGTDAIGGIDIRGITMTSIEQLNVTDVRTTVEQLASFDLVRATIPDSYAWSGTEFIIRLSGEGGEVDLSGSRYQAYYVSQRDNVYVPYPLTFIDDGLTSALDLTGSSQRDVINGTGFDDTLRGDGGDDTIRNSAGDDTMIGGLGHDVYINPDLITPDGGDTIIEMAGEGIDRVETDTGYTLNMAANVENLTLTGTANIVGYGNALNNLLRGNDANNTMGGNDGNDTILGNGGNDFLIGQAGSDSLVGGAGDDTLNGQEGTDRLEGGAGNDVYRDVEGDVVDDGGGGVDRIEVSASFSLNAYLATENLTLTGSTAIYGYGNWLNNVIRGNAAGNVLLGASGDDQLFGEGGNDTLIGNEGSDSLYGGAGDDVYREVARETIYENPNGGLDRVETDYNHKLAAFVENLTLTGSAPVYGYGNGEANVIRGNEAANVLAGDAGNDQLFGNGGNDILVGGLGTDKLYGGAGNDTYRDVEGDTVFENPNGGIDRIETSGNYKLTAFVEELTITGNLASYGYGNGDANLIRGNNANNVLAGDAGDDQLFGNGGNDILVGGLGRDRIGGGDGADTVRAWTAAESTGTGRDEVIGFDFDQDTFDVTLLPTSIGAAVSGSLSLATFDLNLTTALDAGRFGARQALLFDPTGGDLDLAATRFLIVDANGIAGYQAGEDLVFQLSSHGGSLTIDDFV